MHYSDELLEEIRSRNDIVDIIGGYVKLQRKGSNYFGLCPFHNEKTPSFSVSPSKQMYYCFGCHRGGSVFTFLMEYENLSFDEAVHQLAERAGMQLPEHQSAADRQRASRRQQLLDVNKLAAEYYYLKLKSEAGEQGRRYLKGRELTDDTILHFGLGYAGKYNDELYQFMKSRGYRDELLRDTGLFNADEKRGFRDKFWNRVMFPIMDVNNKVIAFGGRVMGDGKPKYLNSNETDIFNKRRNLYGLNYARRTRRNYLILCEGYMDVIQMHQAGFTNAVASLGTAFTSEHCLLLKRYTKEVRLAYDSDEAGHDAALRAIPVLREAGINVRVIRMEPCKDPDEYIKKFGRDKFEEVIEKAQNGFMFEIEQMAGRYDMTDPGERSDFIQASARKMLFFGEPVVRDSYEKAFAAEYGVRFEDFRDLVNRLGASMTEEQVIRDAHRSETGQRAGREAPAARKDDSLLSAQKLMISWFSNEPKLIDVLDGILEPEDFSDPLCRKVAGMIYDQYKKEGSITPVRIVDSFENTDEYNTVCELFNTTLAGADGHGARSKAVNDLVKRIKRDSLDRYRNEHASDPEAMERYIQGRRMLNDLKIKLQEDE